MCMRRCRPCRFLYSLSCSDRSPTCAFGDPGGQNLPRHDVILSPDGAGLHWAALTGNLGICDAMLLRGAPVNSIDCYLRSTPLHLAALQGHVAVAGRLLQAGADAMAKDHLGRTPRDLALESGHSAAEALLLQANQRPVTPEG